MSYEPTEWVKGTKITATKLNNIEQGVQSVNSEYTPTTWAEGDIVTATKLNNIEQGIANAGGGGGGGDFSTAEVDITVIPGGLNPLWIVALSEGYESEPPCVYTISVEDSETFIVPLYKGAQIMYSNFGSSITNYISDVTGDAELTENSLIITGDCSFTIDYSGV